MNDSIPDSANARPQNGGVLLILGMLAGPLYIVVGLAQVLLREGFDVRRHALSLLSNGAYGWVQIANFLVCGLLVVAGAIGVRRAIGGERGGTWGPILLAVYGLGLVGAGIFRADPGAGFPPETAAPEQISTSGMLHFVFGGIGFYALIAACMVFARRFGKRGRKAMAWYSVLTGVGFFAAFAGIASGSTSSVVMIIFYIAIGWIWVWHTIVLYQVLRDNGTPPASLEGH